MSVKQYETIVKKIKEAPEDKRADLVKEKNAMLAALRAKTQKPSDKRALKFHLDEANNQ